MRPRCCYSPSVLQCLQGDAGAVYLWRLAPIASNRQLHPSACRFSISFGNQGVSGFYSVLTALEREAEVSEAVPEDQSPRFIDGLPPSEEVLSGSFCVDAAGVPKGRRLTRALEPH